MGFRLRRSAKVVPGVRINLSKSGAGVSIGGIGGRYSMSPTGRRTRTLGSGIIPGVYYQTQKGGSRTTQPRPSARAQAAAPPPPPPPPPPKPGLLAPRGEKDLYAAVQTQDPHAIRRVGDTEADFRVASYSIAGLMLLDTADAEAESLLEPVFASHSDPAADAFMRTYMHTRLDLPIAPGITATLPINRDAIGLALAEVKQRRGDLAGAIDVVEQLEPTTYAAVSLAELYAQSARWDDVVRLTEGTANADDASMLLLAYRAEAFREQGFHDAAAIALKEALRFKSRAPEIRRFALMERARVALARGRKAAARKDLETILAEDSAYPGVREALAELGDAATSEP
ncbi:MAG: DUF4236 domain-containing protein [Gaiellales bacterium]